MWKRNNYNIYIKKGERKNINFLAIAIIKQQINNCTKVKKKKNKLTGI